MDSNAEAMTMNSRAVPYRYESEDKSGRGKKKDRRHVKHVERAAWRAEVDRLIYGADA